MSRADFKFYFPHRIRYHEVDRQDVVFNGHYLTYFSTAIVEFLRELGSDYYAGSSSSASAIDFHIVKSLVEYRAPIRFDQEIEVFIRVARVGTSSLTYAAEIHPRGEERLLASSEIVWAAADQRTHSSVPVPEDLVRRLNEYQACEEAE
jgi:acyl-CoA thioester hydrolase